MPASTEFNLETVLQHAESEFENSVARLSEFLRIPSISTDPSYDAETRRAADWVAAELAGIGFDASVRSTNGHPIVVAHHDGPADAPQLLYYGHYDVQPPDPLELWTNPPFEPTIVDGPHGQQIVARGAVDDKGQLMLFVEAFRAWKSAHGTLPARVTVLLEGEEESGSPSLDPFLSENKAELAADVCMVSDTGMLNIDTPAITTMLRGLVYVEVTLTGPSHDLHSGMYGGAALNPINALARLISELHDESGRIQVPGFYDDVEEPDASTLAQWNALGVDEAEFLNAAGLKTPSGERGRTLLERIWSRPTCDVNGIVGGYTGHGAKTVIASQARAKISFRLVPSQDPKKILTGLERFLNDRKPADARISIKQFGASPAIRVASDSPYLQAAKAGLGRVYANTAVLIGSGGSIPVVGSIQRILGFDSLLVGFGLDDDRVHSPNEKFELTCYRKGILSHAAMLAELAATKTG